ncbi:MAG: glycosyltransferase, partial [bacterium]
MSSSTELPAAFESDEVETVRVRCASLLAADALLAVVDDPDGEGSLAASIVEAPGSPKVRSETFSLPARGGGAAAVLVAMRANRSGLQRCRLRLSSQDGGASSPAIEDVLVELRTLIRMTLASLDAKARQQILDFAVHALAESGDQGDQMALARSLNVLRNALREPSPRAVVSKSEPTGLHIDSLIRLDAHSFFIRGWMRDAQAPIVDLRALTPEGEWISILDHVCEIPRPDVLQLYGPGPTAGQKLGFLGHFTTRKPSILPDGWIVEVENGLGIGTETEIAETITDPVAARSEIIAQLATERGPDTAVLDHVAPAIEGIQKRLADAVEVDHVTVFGSLPQAPEVSIVVPLYKRIDLVEHQLAQFAADPELRDAELIFVLDSPELVPALTDLAPHLHALYEVPFKLVELSHNGGFSVANNLGAEQASGRLLLLLNSDVIPTSPGWLREMSRFHASKPEIGALGPKLLFEDDSLQHAGLYFRRPAPSAAWENAHFFKGLHRDLPAANVARRVPAVTGACLMIERELYSDLGGLSSAYIQGDYEDSDLCLRLHERGREVWYCPDVELYHLEGRSYGTDARRGSARYNSWIHTRLWGEAIERIM